jgi:hypothetical protein
MTEQPVSVTVPAGWQVLEPLPAGWQVLDPGGNVIMSGGQSVTEASADAGEEN